MSKNALVNKQSHLAEAGQVPLFALYFLSGGIIPL